MSDCSIALIGCGVISRVHLNAFKDIEGASIHALCDLSEEALNERGDEYGIDRRTTQAKDLFDDPSIDAVILALPTGVRTDLALQALNHGKHVLLEKPVAMNLDEVDAMQAVRGDRVVACCSSRFRDYPSARAAHAFLRSGKLGTIRTIHCRALRSPGGPPPENPPPWRLNRRLNGGGILVNWGSYDLDFLLGLLDFDLVVQEASARCWTVPEPMAAYAAPGSDAETHVKALVRFEEGCVLDYERAEFNAFPEREEIWEIIGDNGTLSLSMLDRKNGRVAWHKSADDGGIETEVIHEGDESDTSHTLLVDRNFVQAIRGETPPLTDLTDARLVQSVTDAIYAAAGVS